MTFSFKIISVIKIRAIHVKERSVCCPHCWSNCQVRLAVATIPQILGGETAFKVRKKFRMCTPTVNECGGAETGADPEWGHWGGVSRIGDSCAAIRQVMRWKCNATAPVLIGTIRPPGTSRRMFLGASGPTGTLGSQAFRQVGPPVQTLSGASATEGSFRCTRTTSAVSKKDSIVRQVRPALPAKRCERKRNRQARHPFSTTLLSALCRPADVVGTHLDFCSPSIAAVP